MKRITTLLVVLFLCSSPALAVTGGREAMGDSGDSHVQPVTLDHSQQWDVRSEKTGQTYRIFVSFPKKPAPSDGYHVLYVLDANKMFLTTVETVRSYEHRPDRPSDAVPTVVVGIGYPPHTDISRARTRDLTPPAKVEDPRLRSSGGGADRFLDFIQGKLKPEIEKRFPIDREHQALLGHSFGGLFVLHTLVTRPGSFQTYLAASASLWYANREELKALADFSRAYSIDKSGKSVRVLLTVGEYEGTLAPWASSRGPDTAKSLKEMNQVNNIRKAAQLLDHNKYIVARFQELMGEDHGTVVPAAISRAVRFLEMPASKMSQVPSVPSAKTYVSMTAEQRYRLRMLVRGLPDAVRIPWLNQLKRNLEQGLSEKQHKALDTERNLMDRIHGTSPRSVNAQ